MLAPRWRAFSRVAPVASELSTELGLENSISALFRRLTRDTANITGLLAIT
jgi:hypothetical protein